ncbi:MAG: exodeoxyribonuclease V subunit beta [gamma proteobacterium symbiont of Taylorina sp.]|nr:exodeoxyribonuclease V subunit beta [gamma proteobacterium symbiont of Taylorina sp.]
MTTEVTESVDKLDPSIIPLSGRHLIEASAGTGKTYNITRLYLRLLLEKELTVQQILVMTFTKAATEELRGRIDKELRNALTHWGNLGKQDPFFKVMEDKFQKQQAEQKLKPALLELDEAAIYTIHGFCSRALSSQAFASGLAMDISMESDCSELLLESVRDWLRQINQREAEFALLKEKNWHNPEQFLKQFYRALSSSDALQTPDPESLQNYFEHHIDQNLGDLFNTDKIEVKQALEQQQQIIFAALVDARKDEDRRRDEWQQILWWLDKEDAADCPKALGQFINGNRYRGNEQLKQIFEPLKELKTAFSKHLKQCQKELQTQINNTPLYQLAAAGINTIRHHFSHEKEQQAIMDFDDLITYLSKRVQTTAGQDLVTALRQQYPVALVDEFQDTDPDQYAIFDVLYPTLVSKPNQQSALFMIGDPKQAIYAFRGGDIFTYLQARKGADYHWYMDTNWRSVAGVVMAYNHLFSGQALGAGDKDVFGYDIAYENIHYTPEAEAAKLPLKDRYEKYSAINYCWLNDVSDPSGKKGDITTDDWRSGLAKWCVIEISRLLVQAELDEKPLQEKHIAILVRTGTEAQLMRNALTESGFPSVYLSDKESIFNSQQAGELLRVLKGILEAENNVLLIAALSTCLMGGNAAKLALYHEKGSEQAWEKKRDRAIALRDIWLKKGCMTMLMQLITHDYQPEPSQHERSLTNMIHLAELLQQASRQYKHPQQLLKWFTDQCQVDNQQDEAQLRLESDANLIRIVTLHGSKGLEYPIVFIPFASAYKDPVRFGNTLNEHFKYHDVTSGQIKQQIGQSEEAIKLVTAEGEAETIRLLYVAVTRAAQRCYLGIAPMKNSFKSPLGLSLKLSENSQWEAVLQELVKSSDGSSKFFKIDDKEQISVHCPAKENEDLLILSQLNHAIDERWALSSFSALTRDSYSLRQEQKDRLDESVETTAKASPDQSLRFSLRKGADSGNLLHDILEQTNFKATCDWPLDAPLRRFGGLQENEKIELVQWLQECLDAWLPGIGLESEPFRLSDLNWSQTIRETEFYFPVQELQIESLNACLQAHRGDKQVVNLPEMGQLTGMMRGFIDLIFEHKGRFYVADYKSTHLGDQLRDYHWQALKDNNQRHYYDLQYLIYSLALHRYLSERIADYDAKLHFGGVYYLYLRGMNTQSDEYYGIYHSVIDVSLLHQLDQIFQGKIMMENST